MEEYEDRKEDESARGLKRKCSDDHNQELDQTEKNDEEAQKVTKKDKHEDAENVDQLIVDPQQNVIQNVPEEKKDDHKTTTKQDKPENILEKKNSPGIIIPRPLFETFNENYKRRLAHESSNTTASGHTKKTFFVNYGENSNAALAPRSSTKMIDKGSTPKRNVPLVTMPSKINQSPATVRRCNETSRRGFVKNAEIDLFFMCLTKQVQRSNLSIENFVSMQINIINALSAQITGKSKSKEVDQNEIYNSPEPSSIDLTVTKNVTQTECSSVNLPRNTPEHQLETENIYHENSFTVHPETITKQQSEIQLIENVEQPEKSANIPLESNSEDQPMIENVSQHEEFLTILPILTQGDIDFIDFVSTYHGRHPNELIIKKLDIRITKKDIWTLSLPGFQVNCNVINFYMKLLAERSAKNHILPKVFTMHTNFLETFRQQYNSYRKNNKKSLNGTILSNNIFFYDIILIPVLIPNTRPRQWRMAIIHMRNRTIRYYDPTGQFNLPILDELQIYLNKASEFQRNQSFDFTGWIKECRGRPHQVHMRIGDDAILSCMIAEYITRGSDITFSHEDAPFFRKKMIFEIGKGRLLM